MLVQYTISTNERALHNNFYEERYGGAQSIDTIEGHVKVGVQCTLQYPYSTSSILGEV